jgi:hypothetical protein
LKIDEECSRQWLAVSLSLVPKDWVRCETATPVEDGKDDAARDDDETVD